MCRPATAQQVRGDYSAGGACGHKRPVKTDPGGAAVSCLTCCSFISPRVSALVRRKSRPGGPADPGPLRPPRTQPDPSAAGPQRGGADGHMPGCCWLCHGSSHGDPASPADVWVRERARSGNWSEPALGRMTSARHTCFPLPLAHPSHLPADATGQAPAAFPALLPVCVSSGHHHKGPPAGQLKQPDSLSPGLEAGIPDPGVGGAGPPEASLLGVQTAVSSPCPHRVLPLCVCVLTSSSYKDPSRRGLGPHPSDPILAL